VVLSELARRLVPDVLWEIVEPLVPGFSPGPQGGGTASLDERLVFTAIVYVLTSGCTWQELPGEFGVTRSTAHRRFAARTAAGLWPRLHLAVLDDPGGCGMVDWSSAIVDAAAVRAKKRGRVDRP
jgi:transposase